MINIFRSWLDRYLADEEAVLLLVLMGLGLIVVLTMGNILAPMFAGLVIAFLLQGMVSRLEAKGVKHVIAVILAFMVMVGILMVMLFILMPLLWHQLKGLFSELPGMMTEWQQLLLLLPQQYPELIDQQQVEEIIRAGGAEIGKYGQDILSFSFSSLPVLVSALIYLVLVPILVFFFLKDSDAMLRWVASFLPKKRPIMSRIWHEMNQQIANYVRGKVIEIFIVAIVTYVAFVIIDLNYALLLAIAVGLSVVIPYIGAAVVTLPVAMIGLFQWGWGSEFYTLLIVYGVIQALDGNVLVPLLFSEAVNLHPVAIILAVLVFGGVWGFWGVFFAIPLATLIKATVNAWPQKEDPLESEAFVASNN